MKELRITLTEEQHEKLKAKLEHEGEKKLEYSTLSGFTIMLKDAFSGMSWLVADMNGETDLDEVEWEIN